MSSANAYKAAWSLKKRMRNEPDIAIRSINAMKCESSETPNLGSKAATDLLQIAPLSKKPKISPVEPVAAFARPPVNAVNFSPIVSEFRWNPAILPTVVYTVTDLAKPTLNPVQFVVVQLTDTRALLSRGLPVSVSENYTRGVFTLLRTRDMNYNCLYLDLRYLDVLRDSTKYLLVSTPFEEASKTLPNDVNDSVAYIVRQFDLKANEKPWVEEYRPKQKDQIVGNKAAVAQIEKWVQEKRNPKSKSGRLVLFVHGDPGTGKTSCVHAVLKQYFQVVDLNASEEVRSADAMKAHLTKSARCTSGWGTHSKPVAIVLDEIDGATDAYNIDKTSDALAGGGSGVSGLIQFIKDADVARVTASCCPIVCIANSVAHASIKTLMSMCEVVRWFSPFDREIEKLAMRIAQDKHMDLDSATISKLVAHCKGDIRLLVNTLHYWNSTSISTGHLLKHKLSRAMDEDVSDLHMNMFACVRNVVGLRQDKDAYECISQILDCDADTECMFEMVFQNYGLYTSEDSSTSDSSDIIIWFLSSMDAYWGSFVFRDYSHATFVALRALRMYTDAFRRGRPSSAKISDIPVEWTALPEVRKKCRSSMNERLPPKVLAQIPSLMLNSRSARLDAYGFLGCLRIPGMPTDF